MSVYNWQFMLYCMFVLYQRIYNFHRGVSIDTNTYKLLLCYDNTYYDTFNFIECLIKVAMTDDN